MTARAVLIGIGNEYRHDDGIGPRLITELAQHDLPGVRLAVSDGEPAGLLTDWAGTDLAIIVDTVLCEPAHPGRIHRTSLDELRPPAGGASSHGLGIPEAVALARVLDQLPARLVVFAVEASDISLGVGLSPQVEKAIPALREAVLAELATIHPRNPLHEPDVPR